jgi:sterol desaturase/sphingolipid hydroxylase (fatty acid hydroxylase superfamily)
LLKPVANDRTIVEQIGAAVISKLIDFQGIIVLLLIFLPLERLVPNRPTQRILRRHWANDTVYLLINPILILLAWVTVVAAVLAGVRSIVPQSVTSVAAGLPIWAQAIIAIMLADVGFYFAHRLLHAVPFLWRFHSVHHSIEELDWLAAHRVHPLDQIFVSACSLVPVYALGFSGLALAIMGFVYLLQSHLIHSNVRIGFGPLRWIIASPLYHHWHHAYGNRQVNFSAHLTYLDWIFGTLHLPEKMPERLGIDDPVPADYLRQLAYPVLPAPKQEPAE